jgi:integrase/recombinase XerC
MQLPHRPGLQSFLDYLQFEKRYSVHTVRSYHDDLVQFFNYLEKQFGNKIALPEITHTYIRSWLADLKEQEMSSKSINRKISTLKSFFKYHLKNGTVDQSPMGKIISPKISKRLPVFINEEDTGTLLNVLSTNTEDWKSLNASLLVLLFYATGMRLSELINLKESHIDFSRRQVKVLGKGNKERIIPVSPEVLQSVRDYIQDKKKEFEAAADSLLVTEKGKKIYPKYAYLLVRDTLKEIKTLQKKSPHILRHTFATHLSNGGADLNAIKELLGHSSLAATQIYTHTSIEKLKDIHKKAHPRG